MPGFFVTNTQHVPELINYDSSRCVSGEMQFENWTIRWNTLNKFQKDKIFYQDESIVIILDGIIFNKRELIEKTNALHWHEAVKKLYETSSDFFEEFRGAFSGAIYDKAARKWICFTDQVGNRLVLQYCDGEHFAFGSQLNYFADWMKANNIQREICPEWENDFFAYGFMLDKYTILCGVERVFPGAYVIYDEKEKAVQEHYYYRVEKKIRQRSEEEAIRELDAAFTAAVNRATEKCKEYGYGAVVDISGGLDSRIIAATLAKNNANKLKRVTGINYAQTGCLDQTIPQQIARKLNIELFHMMMDGGNCLKQIDDLVFMNQGMNYFLGITGGKTVLESLDRDTYGLELWGILGDIYEGAMITTEGNSAANWHYSRFRTGGKFPNNNTYRSYSDNEMLWFYVRGMLAGENTAFIRQNFLEAPAVFGDVDFMDVLFSIPYEDRVDKHLLRKWMIQKYPEMANIIYSGTEFKVITDDRIEAILKFLVRVKKKLIKTFRNEYFNRTLSMNPLQYWLATNHELRTYWDQYFEDNIVYIKTDSSIYPKVCELYNNDQANVLEKSMALTAISAVKQYIAD